MLHSLQIKNYALIDALEIDFSDNFSIITGETGAGKSILLGALGLVLGNRADLSALKDEEQKCVIEAHFKITNYKLQSIFEENNLDYEDTTIIRREILPSGKSRAFVNDSPVNLQELQVLSSFLIDIHSQHQTLEILSEDYQLQILDIVSRHGNVISEYKEELKLLTKSKKEYQSLVSERENLLKEKEYNSFLFEELVSANLKNTNIQELEEELEKLSNVEAISENLARVISLANEEQLGTVAVSKEIKLALQKNASFSKNYTELLERFTSVQIEYEDIINECVLEVEKVISEPEKLELIGSKLQLIYNLFKKHQVNSISELLNIQEALDAKLVIANDIDNAIGKLEKNINESTLKLEEKAKIISEKRKEIAPKFSKAIVDILTELGMPEAQVVFEIKESKEFLKTGKNTLELLFSANKGKQPGMLKKVASGGEMSRIMLAIKSILAKYSKLPTIIFDEIDTGVSGEIANKMGEIMKDMSKTMQVFAITHLPQIASKGDSHFKVYKITKENSTQSEIKQLSKEERITEIAQMLSGATISESALTHAKELLN